MVIRGSGVRGSRLLVACLLCCVAGLAALPVAALGEGSSSEGPPAGEVTGGSSSLGGPLVTPGSPTQGEQARAAEEAKLANPEAISIREESRTKFEGLDTEAAAKLAGEAFPQLIDEPAGGPPKLPAGQSITSYPSDNAASLDLGEGKHGVLESLAPIAVQTGPGQRVPVDLGLRDAGSAFEPTTPVVGVHIPKQLSDGVQLSSVGVSLTPVDEHGVALGGSEGAIAGATVFYGSTGTDVAVAVKPVTFGFDLQTLLYSIRAPGKLFFQVGLPEGATLTQSGAFGGVQVLDAGQVIATIESPSAQDAEGTSVPVSMSVEGDVLSLTVDHLSGSFRYPIAVDPGLIGKDTQLTGSSAPTNWYFCMKNVSEACTQKTETLSPFRTSGWGGTEGLSDEATGEYSAGAYAEFRYKTQGESKIFEVTTTTEATNNTNPGSNMESSILLKNETGTINNSHLFSAENYGSTEYPLSECTNCTPIENHNSVVFQQSATAAGTRFHDKMSSAAVRIRQEVNPTITYDKTDEHLVVEGHEYLNVLAGKGAWLGPNSGAVGFTIEEKGIGVSHFTVGEFGEPFYEQNLISEHKCQGIQCPQVVKQDFTYNSKLQDGEPMVYVYAYDAAEGWEGFGVPIKVDSTKPHGLEVTGLPSSGVINETTYHLQAAATDGSGKTPSSGVKSLVLALDGYVLPGQAGSCTPGPCTATGEWTINGEEFGAGKHTLTVQAIDYAGNEETKTYNVTVRHASPLPVGPGSVDPITGALHLGASDVSISGGIGSLGVSRSYNSRQLTAGEQGPLGPQWSLNISGSRGVEQEPTGSVVLIGSDGERTTFESNGKGGYISPKGDENLVLEAEKEGETIKAYLLKDPAAGTTVKYTQPGGAGPWVIASSEGVLSKTTGGKETVEWERVENVTRPKLALAPVAAGVKCSTTVKEPKELAVGCRALSFTYATETTATGEAPSQWKAYKGRLMTVSFTAYNPASKAMETKPVAEYAYDTKGRLRAEWDPRITPSPLKTAYGYDSEGHVVAVNPPGEEPWLIHYGTTSHDTSAGRLLSVTRPPAGTSTQVKEQAEQAVPVNTAVPALSSTSPVIGTTLSIASNGTWSNSPLAYSDVWEDCYTYGTQETCTAIPGAVNSTYTPQARDAGYTLRTQVTAVNAAGATVATTAASNALAASTPAYLRKFGEKGTSEKGQFNAPVAGAIDSAGNVWLVDHSNNRVEEWSSTGTWLHTYGSKGVGSLQFESPEGIAINTITGSPSIGDVYVADRGNNRIEELSSEGKYVRAFGAKGSEPGQLNTPLGVAVAPNGNVWVGDYANDRIDEFTEAGAYIGSFGTEGSGNGQFKGPDGIAFSGGNAYVVDVGNDRVQEFSMSGQYIAKFGSKGTGNGQFETPYGIATEPVSGDLYVADTSNNRIEEFSPAGTFLLAFGKKGEGEGEFSSPQAVAVNSTGYVYVPDTGNNRVQELEPKYSTNNPLPEPPVLGTSAVTTVDYNVPLAGAGAPHEMTKTELEKWGQTDDPVEPVPGESLATAVFPPDEPMGWPAKDYKRATITYLDELGRTVNRASPSGGIATSEYNETNEVVRSLSADNRAAALKESKSKEAAELLDTKSKYNGETKEEKEKEEKEGVVEPGTRLLEVRGPQHTVKLVSGSEVKARNHVKYSYDEGAPGGEIFDLVTKTTDGAEYEGKEADVRTSTTSYSGQENLGWLLRKPTSVTTDPSGLKLVHTTFYDPRTGNVTETRAPAAGGGGIPVGAYLYSSQVPSLKAPGGVAMDSAGHVWVADTEDSRVVELSSTGEYITAFGTEGTGNVQFKKPRGIAVDSEGHIWVADTGNDRVEEISSTGTFIRAFGSEGTETGKFKKPTALAIDSSGNVWVADTENNRVQEFSSSGTYLREYHESGVTKPEGIAADTKGDVWVAVTGPFSFVVELSSTGKDIGLFGKPGTGNGEFKEPAGIAISGETAYVVDRGNNRVQEFKLPAKEKEKAEYVAQFGTSGTGNGQFKTPQSIALEKEGHVWVADAGNNRMQEFKLTVTEGKTTSEYVTQTARPPGGVAMDSAGHVWVADTEDSRVDELSSTGEYINGFGTEGTGNVQFKKPRGIAVDSEGHIWVADTGNDRVEEISSAGVFIKAFGSEGTETGKFKKPTALAIDSSGNVWVADTENNRVQEFSSSGTYLREYHESGVTKPEGIAADTKGDVWVAVTGPFSFVVELSSTGKDIGLFGKPGTGNGEFKEPAGIAISGETAYVVDRGNSRVQEFKLPWKESEKAEYVAQFGTSGTGNGQFKTPQSMALDKEGHAWIADMGNSRMQKFTPNPGGPHAAQTVYYSAGPNAAYPGCGEHPEWANLPCRAQPAAQPTKGDPLPVATDTYNMWDEPETITEEVGSTTRTKKLTYDTAGRALTSEETATGSSNTAVPKVTDEYSSETGVMIKQSTTAGETTKSIKSVYDTLGQLTEYTDADGNTTQYVYSGPANDGQVEEVSYGGKKGSQMYSYDTTTKALTKLLDVGSEGGAGAGTFTAGYDVEGKMTSETYPNGMTAKYTFNPASETTGIEYEKTTHCTEKCTWFNETIAPSIHGEALSRTSTLAKEAYTYDNAGRLTQVNETPTGKGCKTRIYAYNEDSDRTSETTRESATETCATTGGSEEKHTYDEADRLIDTGVEYEALGNQTKIPAVDAGEHEITASFYTDNQTAVQKQNGETTNYSYDPAGRTEKTVSEGTTKSTVVNHYPGPGEAISWACEEAAKECEEGKGTKWTRNIPGIDGSLAATQHNSEATILQLHDLEGNIVATAAVSETETKLLTTYNPTEFGVPVNGTPPTKYSWLGADGLATETSSGAANPGGGSYVSQLGRPLQTEPVAPPGAPDGTYVNPYIGSAGSGADFAGDSAYAAGAPGREAERQKAAAEAAEKSIMACLAAGACGTDPPKEILLSLKGTESLIAELESGDNDQSSAAEVIDTLLDTETADIASFVTSAWLEVLEINLQACAGDISPATLHGGCLLVFKKFEWEGYLLPELGLYWERFEVYNGLFDVYSCYKQHGTDVKNLLICPEGSSDRVFENR